MTGCEGAVLERLFLRQLPSDSQRRDLQWLAELAARPGCRFLEVGTWLGDSGVVLGQVAKKYGGVLICVDWWRGSVGTDLERAAQEADVLALFRERMKGCGLEDVVIPLVSDSHVACQILRPETFDLIFIDGDHRYENILRDIRGYAPLVRRDGGILCGHDCDGVIERFRVSEVKAGRDQDVYMGLHAGVDLAVSDCFSSYFVRNQIWSVGWDAALRRWRPVGERVGDDGQSEIALGDAYCGYRIVREQGEFVAYRRGRGVSSGSGGAKPASICVASSLRELERELVRRFGAAALVQGREADMSGDPGGATLGFFRSSEDLHQMVAERNRGEWTRVIVRPGADEHFIDTARLIAQSVDAFLCFDDRDFPERADSGDIDEGATPVVDGRTPRRSDLVLIGNDHPGVVSRVLLDYVDQLKVTIFCSRTARYYADTPLLFTSIPKAGTHMMLGLFERFGYRIDRPPVQGIKNEDLGGWLKERFDPRSASLSGGVVYAIGASFFHTPARRVFEAMAELGVGWTRLTELPIVYQYRHPLGVLISESWHYRQQNLTLLAAYYASHGGTREICDRIVRGGVLTPFVERVESYIPWRELPNVIPISYEELVGPEGGGNRELQRRAIWSLQLKLQVPGSPDDFAEAIFSRRSATFRRGHAYGYREEIGEVGAFLNRYPALQALCQEFGYGGEGSGVPAVVLQAARRRYLGTTTRPVEVLRTKHSVVWAVGRGFLVLPRAFQGVSQYVLTSPELDRDVPGAVARVHTMEEVHDFLCASAKRHAAYRRVGEIWRFTVVYDGRQFYAVLPEQFNQRVPDASYISRLVVSDTVDVLAAAVLEKVVEICQRCPLVVSELRDVNLVRYMNWVYFIPRGAGAVNIDSWGNVDSPVVMRVDVSEFEQNFSTQLRVTWDADADITPRRGEPEEVGEADTREAGALESSDCVPAHSGLVMAANGERDSGCPPQVVAVVDRPTVSGEIPTALGEIIVGARGGTERRSGNGPGEECHGGAGRGVGGEYRTTAGAETALECQGAGMSEEAGAVTAVAEDIPAAAPRGEVAEVRLSPGEQRSNPRPHFDDV